MSMRKPGESAPDFHLQFLDGGSASLSTLTADGPVALAFFKVSCPTCQYTLPFLQRLRDHNVIAISQDSAADTREFHEQFRISLPTLLDTRAAGYPASNAFGIHHVPAIFLVEPGGKITQADSGFSRAGLEAIAERFGAPLFRPGEKTPAFKPG